MFGSPQFRRERLRLSSGGVFDFDAVSHDDRTVALISTSSGLTASGKLGVGKLHKLRADMLFLTLVQTERRLIVLTEPDMFMLCQKELHARRVPAGIEFHIVEIPPHLASALRKARDVASREVRPNRFAR